MTGRENMQEVKSNKMVMIPGLSLNERESLGREWLLCGIPGR
jgi:hypothetical protein